MNGAHPWKGSAMSARGVAVDGGVEGGVVVHLELAIELESAGAGERFGPECIQAGGEIGALFFEHGEAGAIAVGVIGGSIGPLR